MHEKIKVLIVDDHPFFRQGVSFYLNSIQDIELIGGASSGEEALKIALSSKLDLILMDLQMKGIDGIATTKALLESNPHLRILILTSFGGDEKIHQALAAGAAGYCLKDAPPEELLTAIKAVAEGGTYLGRGITPKVLTEPWKGKETSGITNEELTKDLTNREIDVLKLLTEGLRNKEIAQQLIVSEKTVKTHVANILHKLNVKTRTQAALLANKQNLFGED